MGVPSAGRLVAAKPGLGYMVGNRAKEALRSLPICALAMLEGIRHRRCRGPDGTSDQRNAIRAWYERSPEKSISIWRHLSLERWAQHAGCASCSVRIQECAHVRSADSGNGNA